MSIDFPDPTCPTTATMEPGKTLREGTVRVKTPVLNEKE
jgi:hypothetical protein